MPGESERTVFVRSLPATVSDEVSRAAAACFRASVCLNIFYARIKSSWKQQQRVFHFFLCAQGLSDYCSSVGPVKRAFVVRYKDGGSRGFGFVQL